MRSRREVRIVAGLCVASALRVLAFSAAFPFFNNVDEESHVDLVYKYARGHIPSRLEEWDPAVARLVALYGTPEYMVAADRIAGGKLPPPRFRLPEGLREDVVRRVAEHDVFVNHESTQPPLYYAIAAAWYRAGSIAGLGGGFLLYWLRFLGALVVAATVALTFVTARLCFPDSTFVRVGAPLLVAFFPQDAFYAVNSDVLLPLACGGALAGLLSLDLGPPKSPAFHAGIGLLIAASVLIKLPSLALVPVDAALLVAHVRRQPAGVPRRSAVKAAGLLAGAAVLPVALWGVRNAAVVGDVTGSAAKAAYLGWTLKPWGAMLDHPIFTPSGIVTFWSETIPAFWRGEFVWLLQRIASPGWDRFYAVSSLVLVAAACATSWRSRGVAACAACFALSLGFLGAVSVAFDFGDCYYPSRIHPFLVSGRLALGALIPFAILYVRGLEAVTPRRLPESIRWATLGVLVLAMTGSEAVMTLPAARSPYNLFHMF
jgi:hypothetical protein